MNVQLREHCNRTLAPSSFIVHPYIMRCKQKHVENLLSTEPATPEQLIQEMADRLELPLGTVKPRVGLGLVHIRFTVGIHK